jgi:hypothetical protein
MSSHRRLGLTYIVCLVSRRPLVATAVGVDIIPGLLAGKRDLIGSEAEEVAILLVELAFTLDQLASEETVDEGDTRGSPELGARELGERMKVEVIDDLRGGILRGCQLAAGRARPTRAVGRKG